MNKNNKSHIQLLTILGMLFILAGCLAQKKEDEQADCGFGQNFNAKTRKCDTVIAAPAATLETILRSEGDGLRRWF